MNGEGTGAHVPSEAPTRASLRARVLWRVLLPLGLTWVIGSALTLGVALVHTRQVMDRALLDDAYAIAANVGWVQGAPVLQLSDREIGMALFDQSERVFFAVLRQDGSLVAGHGGLREGPLEPDVPWTFADRFARGLELRTVTLQRDKPGRFAVVVAQTVGSRTSLLQQMAVLSLVPQVLLLVLLGWWLRRSVGAELEPLVQLQLALDRRDTRDLSPVVVSAESRDVHRLADATNRLMTRIAQGVQGLREFTGNVAHELRTPLAGIRSLAEHGLAQTDPRSWKSQLQRILHSEERASRMVDQLLALALADESRESIVLVPLPLHDIVRDLILRALPKADAAGVDLGASGLDAGLWAWAQRDLVEGMLSNLLDNALRYGRPAEPDRAAQVTVELVATVESDGEGACIRVFDNGPGLEPEQYERVLQRGLQGRAGQSLGVGAGLGLAIVQRYAELLGGRLELGPGPDGRGLCVSVTLSAAKPAPAQG